MKHFQLKKSMPLKLMISNEIDNLLEVANYKISFTILTHTESSNKEDLIQAQKNQNVSFAKITALIEHILNQSIVTSKQQANDVHESISIFENNIIVLPNITDDILAAALHCKFNSVIAKNTHVDSVVLEDLDDNLCYEYLLIDDDYTELPDTNEWNNNLGYFDTPWWISNDIRTMDRDAADAEELAGWKKLSQEENVDVLNYNLFAMLEEQFDKIFDQDETPGEIIEVDFKETEKWQPKIV